VADGTGAAALAELIAMVEAASTTAAAVTDAALRRL
jgi:hypothetical protein